MAGSIERDLTQGLLMGRGAQAEAQLGAGALKVTRGNLSENGHLAEMRASEDLIGRCLGIELFIAPCVIVCKSF